MHLYIGFTHKYKVVKLHVIYFWREIGLFLVCLTVEKNAGMSENYRFMIDYTKKKKEIY
jgi:hypothetical protein